ncbi:hypothetical protein BC833DRAFT_605023 [Globomyces pollinis-pini]|nr:hypothetical protein BC833DRAFT_605023 [Globomyces pollinis-pini]
MENAFQQYQNIGLAAWFLASLITLGIFTGGIADQLQFGPQRICLLYVENYHKDNATNAFVFDSYSPSCGASISMGWIGILLLLAVTGIRFFFIYKKEEPSRNVVMALAGAAAVWTAISFIMAAIVSSGVGKTCSEFEKSGKSCGAVFGEGFFANDINIIYKKNINTVNAAVGSGWTLVIFWGLYAAFEFYSYRNASLKWW